jgi:hypothetical protein
VDDLLVRLGVLLRLLVPFVFFMASVYLALHVLLARIVGRPESPVLWFFSTVTGPLTWPVRAVLPSSTPERRVRLVSLGCYVTLWLGSRLVLVRLGLG